MRENGLRGIVPSHGLVAQPARGLRKSSAMTPPVTVTAQRSWLLAPLRSDWRLGLPDLIAVVGFLLLCALLIYESDVLPLQYWDESRNANNALGAAMDGRWLAPVYFGFVDHWNTKPPLLIWMMAGFLKAGLPALWAIRLPSILAALATCGLVWAALRLSLKDPIAAAIGNGLLLTSALYVGVHGVLTGDYDGLESLFIVGYVLSFWRVADNPVRPNWLFAAALCIAGAVLTKGIAGTLPLPGCAIILVSDFRRLRALVGDWRTWACGLFVVLLPLGYYLSREAYDPGYLTAVVNGELGGRFLTANEGHVEAPQFYIVALSQGFGAGLLLSPLAFAPLLGAYGRRRDLVVLCLASCVALLVVLTLSRTKLFQYAIPVVPLLAIAVAIGVSDVSRLLAKIDASQSRRTRLSPILLCGTALLCAEAAVKTAHPHSLLRALDSYKERDGAFLARLHQMGVRSPVTVVEEGFWPFPSGPPGRRSSQIIDFYATLYRAEWTIGQSKMGQTLPTGSLAATCSSKVSAWLRTTYNTTTVDNYDGCMLDRLEPKVPAIASPQERSPS
ncbi:MAG TPA: glycosyltransferase family 39 protein [Caulobacteraceae bacterium]|jgi:hypothetical protein